MGSRCLKNLDSGSRVAHPELRRVLFLGKKSLLKALSLQLGAYSLFQGALVTTSPLPRNIGEPSIAQVTSAPGIWRFSARPVT